MYHHPDTPTDEYPKTSREILHEGVEALAQTYPHRAIIHTPSFGVPAYEWEGAGSERGGSDQHIQYRRIVFLPPKDNTVTVIAAGNKASSSSGPVVCYPNGSLGFFVSGGYSVITQVKIPDDLGDQLLAHHALWTPQHENQSYWPLERLLKIPTHHFHGTLLFAYDQEYPGARDGFYVLKWGHSDMMADDDFASLKFRKVAPWNVPNLQERQGIAQAIALHLTGEQESSDIRSVQRIGREPEVLQDFQVKKVRAELERAA